MCLLKKLLHNSTAVCNAVNIFGLGFFSPPKYKKLPTLTDSFAYMVLIQFTENITEKILD